MIVLCISYANFHIFVFFVIFYLLFLTMSNCSQNCWIECFTQGYERLPDLCGLT